MLSSETQPRPQVSPNSLQRPPVSIFDLKEGESAVIIGYRATSDVSKNRRISADLTKMRLFELGLVVHETLTLVHKSPFGGSPMAVCAMGATIGLNAEEAELLLVERVTR